MIPDLDEMGLLPPGVWDCSLSEVQAAFCTNPHRSTLWKGLQGFIANEVAAIGSVALWIDGSFTRRKDIPADIDVVLDLTNLNEAEAFPIMLSLWQRRSNLKAAYHVDAWPRHPAFPKDLSEFFQYAGPKVAAEFQIETKRPKGILRVQT